MKAKKMKNLIKKAKGELSWNIREVTQESGPLRIFTDPMDRCHTIFVPGFPPEGGQNEEFYYLHELGHAIMAEKVHPFFSNGFPVSGIEQRLFPAVTPLINTASDWFVGQWLMDFCREAAISELEKEYEAVAKLMEKEEPPSVDKFFVAVLIIAQSVNYLGMRVECSGFLDSAVQAFLAVPPEKPSVGKMLELLNRLLELGAPLRCRLVHGEGQDVMEFYSFGEQVEAAS